jgi:hypothetical protein
MKIGLIFLGFFYNFLHISKVGQKKKREKEETLLGRIWLRHPKSTRKRARARACADCFAKMPSVYWLTRSGFDHCFLESLTIYKGVPRVLFLHRPWSPTVHGAAGLRRASGPAKRNKDWFQTSAETEFMPQPVFPLS